MTWIMVRISRVILFSIIICFALISCRKESDTLDPVIVFSHPSENQQFDVPDTIPVRATVTDDHALLSVSVVLVNEDLAPVSYTISLVPSGNSCIVNTSIIIDDILLESGNYFVRITASDGTNSKNGFIKIVLTGTPKHYRYALLVTKAGSQLLKIKKLDSASGLSHLHDIPGDYGGSDVSSRDRKFCLAGLSSGDCNAYDLVTGKLAWSVQAIMHPPLPYFENVYYACPYQYVSFYDSKTVGYDPDGNPMFTITLPHDQYNKQILKSGDYLVLDRHYKTGPETFLDLYFAQTGGLFRQVLFNEEIVQMFSKDNDNLVIFSNKEGQAKLQIYNISQGSFFEPVSLPAGKISCAEQISGNYYLLGLENSVYWYDYQHSSVVTYSPVPGAVKIRFETLSGLVYVARPLELKVLTFPQAEQLQNIPLADTLLNFHLVYNK